MVGKEGRVEKKKLCTACPLGLGLEPTTYTVLDECAVTRYGGSLDKQAFPYLYIGWGDCATLHVVSFGVRLCKILEQGLPVKGKDR